MRDGVMHDHEYPFTGKGDNCNYDFGNIAFKPRDYAIVPPNDSEQLKMVFMIDLNIGCITLASISVYKFWTSLPLLQGGYFGQ